MSLHTVRQGLHLPMHIMASLRLHFVAGPTVSLPSSQVPVGLPSSHRWLRLAVGYRRRQPSEPFMATLLSALRSDISVFRVTTQPSTRFQPVLGSASSPAPLAAHSRPLASLRCSAHPAGLHSALHTVPALHTGLYP